MRAGLDRGGGRLYAPARHQASDPRRRPVRQSRRTSRMDRREDHRLEQHPPGREPGVRSRTTPGHPHPLLGDQYDHDFASALLAHRHLPGAALPDTDVSPVPTSISIFGGERVVFPSHPESLLSATTTSPPGLNTPPAATSPPSRSLNCSPAAYATHFARCDTGPETQHHSLPRPRIRGSGFRAGLVVAGGANRASLTLVKPSEQASSFLVLQ